MCCNRICVIKLCVQHHSLSSSCYYVDWLAGWLFKYSRPCHTCTVSFMQYEEKKIFRSSAVSWTDKCTECNTQTPGDFHFCDTATDTDIQIQSDFVSVNLSSFVFAFVLVLFCFVSLYEPLDRYFFRYSRRSRTIIIFVIFLSLFCTAVAAFFSACLWLHQCREYEI